MYGMNNIKFTEYSFWGGGGVDWIPFSCWKTLFLIPVTRCGSTLPDTIGESATGYLSHDDGR
jgi:hypothetical protein